MSNLIAELRTPEVADAQPGQLMDRGRVIDHLLDLRLEAAGNSGLTAAIDQTLGDVPGRNTVELTWWRDTLERLSLDLDCEPAV